MGMKLAGLAKLPEKTQSKYWTEVNCGLDGQDHEIRVRAVEPEETDTWTRVRVLCARRSIRFDYPQSADPQTLNGKCDMYSQALM
ncbi:hypothetical protein KUCAC02_025130 [Chaenocephalus aceratus]|nr:hypothetical protein KUCAC02_025130 [Chaenocephalus aceratus]